MTLTKSRIYKGLVAILFAGNFLNMAIPAFAVTTSVSQKDAFVVLEAWARTSHGDNSAVYMTIKNNSVQVDQLVAAMCDICNNVELHRTELDAETQAYKMRPVSAFNIPIHGALVLEPGANHIMLMGLKRPLIEGERFSLKLIFKSAVPKELTVVVKGASTDDKTTSSFCNCS